MARSSRTERGRKASAPGGFCLPERVGLRVKVQDCCRSRDRRAEQEAVRSLLEKMRIRFDEAPENRGETDFCGVSLYRPQPPRNPKLAPKHYVDGAAGKFLPHTAEEQARLMRDYCARLPEQPVVCYCHYCLEGLKLGGADAMRLASLLFP